MKNEDIYKFFNVTNYNDMIINFDVIFCEVKESKA